MLPQRARHLPPLWHTKYCAPAVKMPQDAGALQVGSLGPLHTVSAVVESLETQALWLSHESEVAR